MTHEPAPTPALHPCPHGCGAQLGIRSDAPDGERGRCGQCRQPTVWTGGQLHNPQAFADGLRQVVSRAMTDAAAFIERVAAGLAARVQEYFATLRRPQQSTPRRVPMWPAAQPATLHAALQVNARPARPASDRRPQPTPATRRR